MLCHAVSPGVDEKLERVICLRKRAKAGLEAVGPRRKGQQSPPSFPPSFLLFACEIGLAIWLLTPAAVQHLIGMSSSRSKPLRQLLRAPRGC